jgi:hypothetical protein
MMNVVMYSVLTLFMRVAVLQRLQEGSAKDSLEGPA